MSEMSFEELLNQSMKEIHPGEQITGRVISVHKDYAALNIGYKADGIIKNFDYSREQDLDLTKVLNIGDELTVVVKRLNDGEGQVVLSRKELVQNQVNEKLRALYDSKGVQHGKVTKITTGGVVAEIEPEITVFIPKSLLSNKQNEDVSTYEGKEIEFVISEFNPARNRCIGDRKRLIVAEEKQKRAEALEKIHEGDIIEGTIINLLDYGAFVDLGGVDGLLHISEMGWGKIKNPKKAFNIGDKIKVLVREVKDGKVSLTAKFPEENPWLLARVNYALGKTVKGKVVRMTDYGAFVALDDYIDALLHVSEIQREKVRKPEDVLTIGQEIEAKVIDFNEVDKKISLSMKALLPEPEPTKENTEDVADVNIEEYAKKMEEENNEN
ncbi:MAG: S1 RNA-binding domain-containing protein [Lachnospiraceae bacterium]|nr:S1 RNA-binding domain-containing protein [Lachnospiraceae bacterium]